MIFQILLALQIGVLQAQFWQPLLQQPPQLQQQQPQQPPVSCLDVCSGIVNALRQQCRQSVSFPSSEDSRSEKWVTLGLALADCIAPIFKTAASDTCSLCLLTNDPTSPATAFFMALKQDVFSADRGKTAQTIVSNIWNAKVSIASNNSTPVSTKTNSSITIPAATTIPSSSKPNEAEPSPSNNSVAASSRSLNSLILMLIITNAIRSLLIL